MRGNIVGLLAAALMAVCGVASANIIYNVDISGGGETVTGTITTNGTLGALTASDIVAWNLSATGLEDLSDIPGFAACPIPLNGGCGVTAEPDGTIDFTGTDSAFFELVGTSTSPSLVVFQAFEVAAGYGLPNDAYISEDLPYVMGTAASVPEPPTAILLAIGLVGLGAVHMRARGRQRAAV